MSQSSQRVSRRFRWIRGGQAGVELVVFAAVLTAAVLHATIRDSIWPISAIYYAMPAGVALLLVAIAFVVSNARRRAGWLTALVLVASWWYMSSVHTGVVVEPRPRADLRVMSWNAYYGAWGYDTIADTIREHQPDLVVLVEAGPDRKRYRTYWSETFPDYVVTALNQEFVLLCRWPATKNRLRATVDRRIRHVTVHGDDGPIEVIFVHPISRPTYDRGPIMTQLDKTTRKLLADGRTRIVICGDFNLPSGSAHLDALRENFRLAHEQPGGPFRPTWPSPLPVLSLDHVWYSKGFVIAGDGCKHPWTAASDHKPVVVDLASVRETISPPDVAFERGQSN